MVLFCSGSVRVKVREGGSKRFWILFMISSCMVVSTQR